MTALHTYTSSLALKLALLFSILFGLSVSAQVYPVQTNISTSGPYLNYLSYYGDDNNHLQLTVTQLDFNEPPILARLRIRIEGPGYELYTNPNATVGQPFLLDAGMPLTITGIDLLPYLQQSNLINPNGVDLNNLPHGFTTICVDVIRESASQEVLSTNNCGFLPIQEYQPPQTFIPTCGDVLDTNTMFHTFTWTPPVPFPAGVGLELFYDFSIYQWADPNNNSALNGNAILIYEETDLIAPTTQVSDFNVIFELGRTYVWKVTARVESNGMPLTLIENGGVSAPCTFIYGEAPTLNDVLADGLELELFTSASSERKGKAWWTVTDNTPNAGLSTFDAYFVEYRKQPTGNEGFEIPWFSKTLSSLEHFIYQLEPSTAYEVKVSGIIAGTVGDPTPVETFTTPDARIYNCGESDVPYLPMNYTPLENATAGTQVRIGQFMMTMTEVTAIGSAGHYKGKGEIPIAFLAGAKAKVRFDDILIDTEYLVHEGRVDVITEGLANWLDDQYQQFIDPYFVEGTIDSAYVQDSVAWVVVDGVPQSFNFDPPNYPIIVNDESGNQYTIYPNGTIVVSSYLSISETWAATADEVIHFTQSDSELRGFDPKEHMEWYENYEVMELGDSSKYFVANKSLAKSEADKVNVEIPSGVTASFAFSDGTVVPSTALQGSWIGATEHTGSSKMTLSIPARSSSGNHSIYALVNGQKVGQLNVKVYSQKDKEVIVVPIASTTISAAQIKAELDQTLGEANIDVSVTLENPWVDSTNTFTSSTTISMPSEVGLLSKYSDDMRELRDAYFEQHPSAPKNKYYLFLVNGFDDPNELGYMVRGRSMGFVKANSSQVLQTISHELGHGMGALEHTFKDDVIAQGSTNNLMDYSADPTNLTVAQWKELRDLDVAPSLFDDVDDYMNVLATLSFDTINVQIPPTGAKTIYKTSIPLEAALMTPQGSLIRFSSTARSRFTHFEMYNGKLIGLYDNNVALHMVTNGYQTKPAESYATTFDHIVENEVGILAFFRMDSASANTRVLEKALKGVQVIDIVTGFASGDVTQIEFVNCNDVGGQYITDVGSEVIYGQIECDKEGECQSEDLEVVIEANKTAVKDAFRTIIQSADGGFNWNPIQFVDGQNHVLSVEDQRVIKEKIRTLNSYRSDVVVGVVVMKGSLSQLYTQKTADSLAKQVVTELSSEFAGKKLVLFFSHYIKGSNENLFTTDHYTCVTSSFAKSEESIVNPVFTSPQLSLGSNVMNNFMLLFTEIKKPYYLTNIYEHYDGSLSYLTVDKTNDTSKDLYGVPFVKGARHLVSANTVSYNSLQGEISNCVAAMEFQGSQWTMTGPGLTVAEAEELFAQKVAELESMIPIWEQESRDNPNDWIAGDTDFDNVRERYLDKGFALYEFEKQNNGFEFFHDLAIVQGLSTVSADVYYEFDAMSKVIDPLVYGVVDLLGVIPGVDFLADGAGFLYAAARGDAESVVVYSAAIFVPFAGAGVIHAGQKFFSYYGKQSSSNVLELTVKQWDEAHDGWVKVSNDIPYEDVNKTTIKNELEAEIPKLTDEAEEILEKVVVLKKTAALALKDDLMIKFASYPNITTWLNTIDDLSLLKKLDDLPDNSSLLTKFHTDVPSLKIAFNGNPDLIDSWRIVISEPSIRNQSINLKTVNDFVSRYPDRATILKQTFEDPTYHPDLFAKEEFLNALKEFDQISTINNTNDLNTILINARSVHKVKDLESKGINKLFRGINVNSQGQPYIGNINSINNGVSASTDPIVACIFSNEAKSNFGGSGKVLLINTTDIKSSFLTPANYRVSLEREVIVKTTPTNLYSLKEMEVDLDQVLEKIDEITGQNISSIIFSNSSTYALENTPRLTANQLAELINSL